MNEKEELLMNINASVDIMKKIDEYENLIIACQRKRQGARGVGRFILIFVICMILAILIGDPIRKIPFVGELLQWIPVILTFVIPIVLRIVLTKIYDNKINEYNGVLDKLKNDPVLKWLPMTYRDSVSYSFISSYIQDMRADNLQDAINLFETEMHRARLEANARGI